MLPRPSNERQAVAERTEQRTASATSAALEIAWLGIGENTAFFGIVGYPGPSGPLGVLRTARVAVVRKGSLRGFPLVILSDYGE
jgi:hypothetical protein